jgi:hypothetical protein
MPRASAGLRSRNRNRRLALILLRTLPALIAWIALSQSLICQSSLNGQRRQKKGRLTVTCPDVDCNVLVNGAPAGATTNRTLSQDLPEGPVAVSVAADGYVSAPDQEIVNIKDGDPKLVKFELRPSRAALEERGSKLFRQMIAAVGGEEGLRAAAALRGTGTLTLYHDGKPAFWQATVLLKPPDKGRFVLGDFQGDRQRYEILSADGVTDLVKMGKGADLQDLNLAVHQLAQYQLPRTFERLQNPGFAIVATDLKPGRSDGTILRAERGGESYSIRFDANLRPQEISMEAGGFDRGTKILYADYEQEGPAYFPKELQVQRAGSTTNGFKIQFDHVQLCPADLTDNDFDAKKGRRR